MRSYKDTGGAWQVIS